ncbi:MAG: hypothetical protein KME60_26070 [Cyanomargarita calcarea GSE-NOS-MK-12-04C]|jgi:hypothetical protein|uniref:Uncharacterized protein n=1 Tax=Cyanomargarita calcarea GSE-NOS-MK-12-04C TaxID=2839659 RepID=A0A951QTY6_9CYAN|nr:hypothetical protein [Cyanomargarita calcarea GSE-NOS-MK-12-04C]
MNLNWKSLSFYGIAIASALMLLKVVTAYGERNLKASPAIGDRYRLTLSQNLPSCEKPEGLMLNIQQSGIYLNGYLSLANTNTKVSTATATKPTLIGRLSNQKLNLSGKISKNILCNRVSFEDNSFTNLTMQMQLLDKSNVTGQMTVNGISKAIEFTAVTEKNQQKSKQH